MSGVNVMNFFLKYLLCFNYFLHWGVEILNEQCDYELKVSIICWVKLPLTVILHFVCDNLR